MQKMKTLFEKSGSSDLKKLNTQIWTSSRFLGVLHGTNDNWMAPSPGYITRQNYSAQFLDFLQRDFWDMRRSVVMTY